MVTNDGIFDGETSIASSPCELAFHYRADAVFRITPSVSPTCRLYTNIHKVSPKRVALPNRPRAIGKRCPFKRLLGALHRNSQFAVRGRSFQIALIETSRALWPSHNVASCRCATRPLICRATQERPLLTLVQTTDHQPSRGQTSRIPLNYRVSKSKPIFRLLNNCKRKSR